MQSIQKGINKTAQGCRAIPIKQKARSQWELRSSDINIRAKFAPALQSDYNNRYTLC